MVKITQQEGKEVPAEVLATSIEQIAKGMKTISGTRLNRRALVTLIHENSRVARRDIELILNNLESLETIWLKPKAKST